MSGPRVWNSDYLEFFRVLGRKAEGGGWRGGSYTSGAEGGE